MTRQQMIDIAAYEVDPPTFTQSNGNVNQEITIQDIARVYVSASRDDYIYDGYDRYDYGRKSLNTRLYDSLKYES